MSKLPPDARITPLSGEVTFHKLSYSKADLAKTPEDEVILFLVSAQLYNDISLIFRLILNNRAPTHHDQAVLWAASEAQLFLVRMLAGRCHEGSKFVAANYQSILAAFEPDLTDRHMSALKEITRYFGGQSLLSRVRNKLSFHLDPETIREAYRSTPDDVELHDLHQILRGNTIFYSAESMFVRTLISLTGKSDPQDALNELIQHALEVAGAFMDATGGIALAYCKRHLGKQLANMEVVVVPDQPNPHVAALRPFVFLPEGRQSSATKRRFLSEISKLPLAKPK